MAGQSSASSDEDQPSTMAGSGPVIPTVVVAEAAKMTTSRRSGKRGRKPAKIDVKAKLERSRQSARECRARKKLRYQYLEELVSSRERAIYSLRRELEQCKQWSMQLDKGKISPELYQKLQIDQKRGLFDDSTTVPRTTHWCHILSDSSSEDSDDSDVFISEEPAGFPTGMTTRARKGKGRGKATQRSASEMPQNESVVTGAPGLPGDTSLSTNMDIGHMTSHGMGQDIAMATTPNIDPTQSMRMALKPLRLPDDFNNPMSTSSPFAIDTSAVDTAMDIDFNFNKQNIRVTDITNIPSSSKRIIPTATITHQTQIYPTINPSDLYTTPTSSAAAAAAGLAPPHRGLVAPPSEPLQNQLPGQLDFLSDMDVIELLKMIEKDTS